MFNVVVQIRQSPDFEAQILFNVWSEAESNDAMKIILCITVKDVNLLEFL